MIVPAYQSLEEKRRYFASFNDDPSYWQIDQESTLCQLLQILHTNKKLIYRGVREAKYMQFTSLQRHYIENRMSPQLPMVDFISDEIQQLKTSHNQLLQRYYNSFVFRQTDYLYLSYLQHYGAPTPLLDFSHNLKVATFFATDGIQYGKGTADIDDYLSLYWLQSSESFIEPLSEMLLNWLLKITSQNTNEVSVISLQQFLSIEALARLEENIPYISNRSLQRGNKDGSKIQTIEQIINSISEINGYTQLFQKKYRSYLRAFYEYYTCITNLNQVAQEGCFLMPINIQASEPIESFILNRYQKPLIYCSNIHKSLVMYLNKFHNFNRKEIYPESRDLAEDAYDKTIKYV